MSELIVNGYTRSRHWETIYHDIADLYGPKIGLDGIGLWFTYRRYVQHAPGHLLEDKAWPSHRGRLQPLFRIGHTSMANTRERLVDAGLITATPGSQYVRRLQEQYDQQLLIQQEKSKPRQPVQRITMANLAAIGIQNPARVLIIEVSDPLSLHPFCEKFNLTYQPTRKGARWEVEFDDYPGLIQGPNRLLAATRWIEDNLNVISADRPYHPLVTEEQINSLLRCKPDDAETIELRNRLLLVRARITGQAAQPLHQPLPQDILANLNLLGWQGATTEVETAFQQNPHRLRQILGETLAAARGETIKSPAALFRDRLRTDPPAPPPQPQMEEVPY